MVIVYICAAAHLSVPFMSVDELNRLGENGTQISFDLICSDD